MDDARETELITRALPYIRDTLALSMLHDARHKAIVITDTESELSRVLAAAYLQCLPSAEELRFYERTPEEVKAELAPLVENDLVVLVQSGSFRMPDMRLRVELFKRNVKVIEHTNLGRMRESESEAYIDSLAYDAKYYQGVGYALKAKMDAASSATVESGGAALRFDSALEAAKLNIGDFSTLKNVGSQFPIGEVFTEAKELEKVHGRVRIYAFTDLSRRLNMPQTPITLVVDRGRVIDAIDSTEDFEAVRAQITADEGEVWLRELGFGMNSAFSPTRTVSDVGAFERVTGIHISLGAKHGVYKKAGFNPREARHHVDVFAVTERVLLDDEVVFENGAWRA